MGPSRLVARIFDLSLKKLLSAAKETVACIAHNHIAPFMLAEGKTHSFVHRGNISHIQHHHVKPVWILSHQSLHLFVLRTVPITVSPFSRSCFVISLSNPLVTPVINHVLSISLPPSPLQQATLLPNAPLLTHLSVRYRRFINDLIANPSDFDKQNLWFHDFSCLYTQLISISL